MYTLSANIAESERQIISGTPRLSSGKQASRNWESRNNISGKPLTKQRGDHSTTAGNPPSTHGNPTDVQRIFAPCHQWVSHLGHISGKPAAAEVAIPLISSVNTIPIPLRIGNMYTPARTTISHIVTFVTVGIDW